MPIRTLIIDDEPHAVDILKKFMQNIPELELSGTYSSAIQAFREVKEGQIDLLFLDINMPGLSGTDLMRSLLTPPAVIFTTAHQEYALDGFDLNAVDYLLKPISFERFLRAVNKLMRLQKLQPLDQPVNEPAAAPEPDKPFYLYMRIDRQLVKVNTDDILLIESKKDYIRVICKDAVHVTKQKISTMENLLPVSAFLRVHRSFIVPLSKVTGYNPNYVMLDNKKIAIGRNYKEICAKQFSPGNQDLRVFI